MSVVIVENWALDVLELGSQASVGVSTAAAKTVALMRHRIAANYEAGLCGWQKSHHGCGCAVEG